MMPEWKLKGYGTIEILHADGSKTTHGQSNMILDVFWAWLTTKKIWNEMKVSCKVGTGSSANTPSRTTIETLVPLLKGSWPLIQDTAGNLATLINSGAQIRVAHDFEFIWDLGQIAGNITEFGLDFTGVTTSSSGSIHTRVLITDTGGNPVALAVKDTDQVRIVYTLEMVADVAVPAVSVDLDNAGVVTSHQVQFIWNKLSPFVCYFNVAGGYTMSGTPADLNLLIPKWRADNRVAPPNFNNGNYSGALDGGVLSGFAKNGNLMECVCTFPKADGNVVGGINFLYPGNAVEYWYCLSITPAIPKDATRDFAFQLSKQLY